MTVWLGPAISWGADAAPAAAGASSASGANPFRQAYEIWQADQNWSQNTVTAITQTRDGYLWLGTYHGLVRFDGVRSTVFDSSNTGGSLVNGLITSLYEDSSGVLWIGHETGQLSRFRRGRFQPVDLGEDPRHGVIEAIATDENGDLWILSDTGWLFRARDRHAIEAPGGASPTRKVTLAQTKGGQIWLAANGTVATIEQGRLVPCQFGEPQAGNFYERVAPAQDGGVWVLGNGKVRKWRQGRWSAELPVEPVAPGSVTTLLETRSGALLVGSLREGLFRVMPGSESQHFSRAEGLSHDWVRALCEDHEGNIWIGTGSGFDGLRARKVQMLESPDQWRGFGVLSFAVEPGGSVWVGTEGAGLYRYENLQWRCYGETNGLTNPYVWSVLECQPNTLYVGTWGGGLLSKNGDRFESPGELSKITEPVAALYQGRHGELWIGTRTGLHRYEGGRLTWFAGEDRLVRPDIRAITESADGTLWFGMSGGGLGSLKDGVLKQLRQTDGLGSDQVVCLYPDPDGALWIGTGDNGLTRLKGGRFAVVTDRHGLSSKIISHIVDDRAGNFWLGSQRGILRVSKEDLNRCADGLSPAVRCLNYGKEEGLASTTCSGGFQPGACQDREGRLWFPTTKGLAIIDPANVTTNTAEPPVQIEAMVVDSIPVDPALLAATVESPLELPGSGDSDTASLPHPNIHAVRLTEAPTTGGHPPPLRIEPGSHRFEFHYTALSFLATEKVRFKYRLEGLYPDWEEAGARRVAPYSYLPPGNYTFRVIACNNDEVWNDAGAAVAFTVLPFFWQTWWFDFVAIGTGAAAVGTVVLWATRRRTRRKLEQLERQRALERERARIARDIHDDLGASLTRIGMLSQSARSELETQPQAAADVDQIYETARELTRAMDEIVWAVNPKHDTLDSLVTYLGRFAQQFLSTAALRCRLDVPVNLPSWALSAEVRHNVFLALKEALNNVIKHAHATEVRIALELQPQGFVLLVADNGRGFDWKARSTQNPGPDGLRLSPGNGLINMQKRLEEIGGRAQWDTAPGEGTRVRLWVEVTR